MSNLPLENYFCIHQKKIEGETRPYCTAYERPCDKTISDVVFDQDNIGLEIKNDPRFNPTQTYYNKRIAQRLQNFSITIHST